ncbi:MAG: hypothetical protein VYA95_04185, partial [Candidatus Thermoplasmatota archaeon]|nr:hypothetical protein [Candidatus Thermoplasmatota archaeon]
MRLIVFMGIVVILLFPVSSAQDFTLDYDPNEGGFKRVRLTIDFVQAPSVGELFIQVEGNNHSSIILSDVFNNSLQQPLAGEWYDDCWTSNGTNANWEPIYRDSRGIPWAIFSATDNASIRCDLTGFKVNQEVPLNVIFNGTEGVFEHSIIVVSSTQDVLPEPPSSAPIFYAIGSIV